MKDRITGACRSLHFLAVIIGALWASPALMAQGIEVMVGENRYGETTGLSPVSPASSPLSGITVAIYQISGHVLDHNNNPVVGVGVYVSQGTNAQTAMVDTDTNGFYSLTVGNGAWTVSVNCDNGSDSLSVLGYNCTDSENVTIANHNATANFIVPNFGASELDGHITDKNGNPLVGVTVSASSPGYSTEFFTTDGNGFYEFIVYNGSWDVSVNCSNLNSLGFGCVAERTGVAVGTTNVHLTNFIAQIDTPAFFAGAASLGNYWFYLAPNTNNIFGYYSMASYPYIYHQDMGFVYYIDANNSQHGAYLYDFTDKVFLYTAPEFFPYLYDFALGSWVYYSPLANSPGRYTSDPRWFYDFNAKKWTTTLAAP